MFRKGDIPWNKNGHHSKETKEKMKRNRPDYQGENNPFFGKCHSEETKQKISKNHADVCGKNNPMFGKHRSEELKRKISKAHKGIKLSEEHKRKIGESGKGRKVSDEIRKKMSEARKGKPRSDEIKRKISETLKRKIASGELSLPKKWKDTSIELIIEEKLRGQDINYVKQKYIKNVGLVDFFLPDSNLIIECDGDYWHNVSGAQQKDTNRDFASTFCHQYKTIRFWEHEINKSPEKCLKKIVKEIGG